MKRQLVLEGKPVADAIREKLVSQFSECEATLATFIIGNNAPAHVYKRSLLKCAESLGRQDAGCGIARERDSTGG